MRFCLGFGLLLVLKSGSTLDLSLHNVDRSILPQVYQMDDYWECKKDQKIFCEAQIELKPQNSSHQVWQMIEAYKKDHRRFDPSLLYRTFCTLSQDVESIKNNLSKTVNEDLEQLQLQASVKDLQCNKVKLKLGKLEFGIATLLLMIMMTVLYCTYWDWKLKNKPKSSLLLAFSLINNVEKIQRPILNEDYQRLKSIQVMRTITMIFVVAGHSILSYISSYVDRPEYIEELFMGRNKEFFYFGLFVVQSFFVFTGWMVAMQVLTVSEKKGQFTLQHIFLFILNRLLRLQPVLLVVLLLHRSTLLKAFLEGPRMHLLDFDYNSCQTGNFFSSVFFLANIHVQGEMCNMGTWYLAVDTQMYIITLFIFYLIKRFKWSMKSLGIFFAISWLYHAYKMYKHGLDVTHKMHPEKWRLQNALYDENLYRIYFTTYAHSSTFLVGVLFGTFYHYYKNKKLFDNLLMQIAWYLIAIPVPYLAIKLSTYDFPDILRLIIGPSIKPLFGFAIAFGVLGFSYNVCTPLKRLFEARPLEILGYITYSTYLIHLGIIVSQVATTKTILPISALNLWKASLYDVPRSFLLGFLVYIFIEAPFNNLNSLLFKKLLKAEDKKQS